MRTNDQLQRSRCRQVFKVQPTQSRRPGDAVVKPTGRGPWGFALQYVLSTKGPGFMLSFMVVCSG